MFDRLGRSGLLGAILMLIGIGAVALENPIIAAGIALVLAGLGLLANGLVRSAMSAFGLG